MAGSGNRGGGRRGKGKGRFFGVRDILCLNFIPSHASEGDGTSGCGGCVMGGMDLSERSELSMVPMPFAALRAPRCSAPQTQGKAPGVLGVSLVMFPPGTIGSRKRRYSTMFLEKKSPGSRRKAILRKRILPSSPWEARRTMAPSSAWARISDPPPPLRNDGRAFKYPHRSHGPFGVGDQHINFPAPSPLARRALRSDDPDRDQLYGFGIRKFVFLNGHGGNTPGAPAVALELDERHAMGAILNWWAFSRRTGSLVEGRPRRRRRNRSHAGH